MSDRKQEHKIEQHKDGGSAPEHSRLHAEAVDSLTHKSATTGRTTHHSENSYSDFSQHGYWAKKENDYYQQGKMVVLEGDTLNTIARKALLLRGASIAGPDAILDEADRIRALNMQNPHYKYLEHSHKISTGMVLDITEPRIGPDIHTAWQPWKDVPAGTTTYVQHGERAVVPRGAKAIVEPGAAALVSPGGASYGYQKSYIESLPGSVTVAAGTVEAAPGAKVVNVRDAKVTELTPDQLRYPQLFPR